MRTSLHFGGEGALLTALLEERKAGPIARVPIVSIDPWSFKRRGYAPNVLEGRFSELRAEGVLGTSRRDSPPTVPTGDRPCPGATRSRRRRAAARPRRPT